MLQASGQEIVIDVASAGTTMPAWWQMFEAAKCRQTSISMNTTTSGAAAACIDWASGQAAGGIGAYNFGSRGANTARLKIAVAVPVAGLADLFAGQEYFSINVVINHAKTVGTGACAGCTTPVC